MLLSENYFEVLSAQLMHIQHFTHFETVEKDIFFQQCFVTSASCWYMWSMYSSCRRCQDTSSVFVFYMTDLSNSWINVSISMFSLPRSSCSLSFSIFRFSFFDKPIIISIPTNSSEKGSFQALQMQKKRFSEIFLLQVHQQLKLVQEWKYFILSNRLMHMRLCLFFLLHWHPPQWPFLLLLTIFTIQRLGITACNQFQYQRDFVTKQILSRSGTKQ